MASIQKRSTGRWRARCTGPDGVERSRHFKRRVDAQAWLDDQAVVTATGTWTDPNRAKRTFGEWSRIWLAQSVHLKPKTIAGYESILERHVLPRLGKRQIGSVDRAAIKAWVAELGAAGTGPGTTKNIVNVAKAVFSAAVDDGAIRVNPCGGVKLPRSPHDEMLFLDGAEVASLADSIDAEYRTLVLFAAYTGLRAGEIAALDWSHVDLMRGSVDVACAYAEVHGKLVLGSTKNYVRRTVGLPRFLVDLLVDQRATTGDGYVFRAPEGGVLQHSNFYRRSFRPAVLAAGVPDKLRFHDLRHTTVALLVAQGAHPTAIKERLGHSSITVTLDQYGHLFPSINEALTEGLDATYREAASRSPRGAAPMTRLPNRSTRDPRAS